MLNNHELYVKDHGLCGTLFIPAGEGPFPSLINIYGGILKGKVAEDRSALFASRGFASLALSFFGTDPGLPKRYSE